MRNLIASIGSRQIGREMLFLVDLDQGCQDIQAITTRRAGLGAPQPLDLGKCRFVIRFGADRFDLSRHAVPS
jgi:hypothetical protein